MKRFKNIEGKNEKQLEAIKDQAERQLEAIKDYDTEKKSFKQMEHSDEKQQEREELVEYKI